MEQVAVFVLTGYGGIFGNDILGGVVDSFQSLIDRTNTVAGNAVIALEAGMIILEDITKEQLTSDLLFIF